MDTIKPSMPNGMPKGKIIEAREPITIKFYPPITEKMNEMNIPNINYWVNKIVGDALGVDPRLIDAYHRNKKDKEQK